jgi:DNA-directed RNA polymerase specialized sigma24 family protein
VLAIDEALSRLAALDERLAQVAELRLFADLSSPDIAAVLGVNARTVERDWLKARTFLSACLMPGA